MNRLADISYCSNEKCDKVDCKRHFNNIPGEGLYSMCTFNTGDTKECEWYWKIDN